MGFEAVREARPVINTASRACISICKTRNDEEEKCYVG